MAASESLAMVLPLEATKCELRRVPVSGWPEPDADRASTCCLHQACNGFDHGLIVFGRIKALFKNDLVGLIKNWSINLGASNIYADKSIVRCGHKRRHNG